MSPWIALLIKEKKNYFDWVKREMLHQLMQDGKYSNSSQVWDNIHLISKTVTHMEIKMNWFSNQ